MVDPVNAVSPQTVPQHRRDESLRCSVDSSVEELSDDAQALVDWFAHRGPIVVAFSGGVDSSVVLAAAVRSGAAVLAATAKSPSVPRWQLDLADRIAKELQAEHVFVETEEVGLPAYRVNGRDRCFHCKSTLYDALGTLATRLGDRSAGLVSGTNADDLGDYRPGIGAGDAAGVLKPLAELGWGKSKVRSVAAEFGLSNADLPASPCLASRIAYGVEVTPERLRRVELAEDHLRQMELPTCRVRVHSDELARVEVPAEWIARVCEDRQRSELTDALIGLGFRYVTLDLQGFSSGSMNRGLVELSQIGQTGSVGTAGSSGPDSGSSPSNANSQAADSELPGGTDHAIESHSEESSR